MTLPEDEMPIDGEVATATIASSVDPIEIHEGEETGAEEPMEVEDETEREGLLLQRQGRTAAPVIWSGSVRNEHGMVSPILLRKNQLTQLLLL
ncbi:hypothetical protein OPV22_007884 [Ensete ventricosum]|uniref:Uncharacterized protein n=1 Tax=Ensete ventricosum TaxID=4639 RepID=A0AAV8R9U3_ENSVE|nr:hypothetical protein OPV22_007884 [Ensete ventricosum]